MPRLLAIAMFCFGVLATAAIAPRVEAGGSRPFFWHPEVAPNGPVVVVVSLNEQRLYAYRNGVAIGVSPISSGRPGYETPPGVYTILEKARTHFSNLYDDAPMPFMQRLTWGGVAIHAGVVPKHPASHGCIRLPEPFAKLLFGVTRRGGVVVVSDSKVAPATLRHPAAVAPIDLTGQPTTFDRNEGAAWMDKDAPAGMLSVVVSLHDQAAYVLADGKLIGRSPIHLQHPSPVTGTVLYVMQPPSEENAQPETSTGTGHVWAAYRIQGTGDVPEPARLAAGLALPAQFGDRLQAMLKPGTTVLVTDMPGAGGEPNAQMQALMESSEPAKEMHR